MLYVFSPIGFIQGLQHGARCSPVTFATLVVVELKRVGLWARLALVSHTLRRGARQDRPPFTMTLLEEHAGPIRLTIVSAMVIFFNGVQLPSSLWRKSGQEIACCARRRGRETGSMAAQYRNVHGVFSLFNAFADVAHPCADGLRSDACAIVRTSDHAQSFAQIQWRASTDFTAPLSTTCCALRPRIVVLLRQFKVGDIVDDRIGLHNFNAGLPYRSFTRPAVYPPCGPHPGSRHLRRGHVHSLSIANAGTRSRDSGLAIRRWQDETGHWVR